ncbi:hypothetical protein BCR42DRAFT_361447 [Absidia repens]|uniref:BHLH domain-containing protein n=1 Tax=Absidia repens TaxID=90262 RepID=A0A1X2HZ34_9FUNG|nr:hypothetical protein BCR42DRAFT_361447 [Absidia repens]
MDPEYDPSHKTSSITSTTSTSSWDTLPSLTASSHCDINSPSMNEQSMLDVESSLTDNDGGLTSLFDDISPLNKNGDAISYNKAPVSYFLDHIPIDGKTASCTTSTLSYEVDSPIFLRQSREIPISHSTAIKQTIKQKALSTVQTETKSEQQVIDASTSKHTNNSDDEDGTSASGKFKYSRDLLSKEEKRANHIASEQKRRNNIRTGFREMIEIIPTLRNINNSKSTILFKAVEYIRHLDKCNHKLRNKLSTLQGRVKVEGCNGNLMHGPHHLLRRRHSHYANEHHIKRTRPNNQQEQQLSLRSRALTALLLQQNQQKQFEVLQKQVRYQQELLTRYNISTTDADFSHGYHRHLHTSERPASLYSSMSIPLDHPPMSVTSISTSSSLSQRHPSVYDQLQRNIQHRPSTPALVMPNTIERGSSPSFADSPAGVSSFNIPADNEFSINLTTTSQIHP